MNILRNFVKVALFATFLTTPAFAQQTNNNGQQATQEPAFSITPQQLTPGANITITYNLSLTYLKNSKDIKSVLYLWRNYHWEAQDMTLKKQADGKLTFNFTLPEGTALIAWKYYDKDTTDVGGDNWLYASYCLTKELRNMPSASLGWAFLRGQNTTQWSIPTVQNLNYRRIEPDVVHYWLQQELMHNPDQLPFAYWYATQLRAAEDTAHVMTDRILEGANYVISTEKKSPVSEDFLLRALYLAQNVLANDSLAKDIINSLQTRYPNGEYQREVDMKNIMLKMKGDEQIKAFEEFMKKYPYDEYKDRFNADPMFSHYYGNALRIYVYSPIMAKKDYSRVVPSFKIAPLSMLATYFWHLVQIPYDRGDATAESLYPLAKQIHDAIFNHQRTIEEQVYSPAEWKEKLYKDYREAWFDYAKILLDLGHKQEAMALSDTLATLYGSKVSDFNTFYIKALQANNRNSEVLPVIKAGLKSNAASPEMLAILKQDYVSQHGSEAGYEAYVQGLKSADLLKAAQQRTLAELISKPAKFFTIEKMQGGQLNMNNLKGKIIVIDFWATWCGPCKAAMPGMQMAVNKYKNDKDVQFLFIATMETAKNFREQIKSFIKQKGYDFQVCYDNVNAKGKREQMYDYYGGMLHSSGIPMKMIIDQKGQLRWFSNGYFGSPTALVDELSTLIDHLKTEK